MVGGCEVRDAIITLLVYGSILYLQLICNSKTKRMKTNMHAITI